MSTSSAYMDEEEEQGEEEQEWEEGEGGSQQPSQQPSLAPSQQVSLQPSQGYSMQKSANVSVSFDRKGSSSMTMAILAEKACDMVRLLVNMILKEDGKAQAPQSLIRLSYSKDEIEQRFRTKDFEYTEFDYKKLQENNPQMWEEMQEYVGSYLESREKETVFLWNYMATAVTDYDVVLESQFDLMYRKKTNLIPLVDLEPYNNAVDNFNSIIKDL